MLCGCLELAWRIIQKDVGEGWKINRSLLLLLIVWVVLCIDRHGAGIEGLLG